MSNILRRKLSRGGASGAEGGPGADQGWRLAFARAARDAVGLLVDVAELRMARRGLAELLDLPPDRALLLLLDGPGEATGMLALSPEVMAALVEMQTIGRLAATPGPARRPTRTDAAMVSGVIDRALAELEAILAEEADLAWAGGFRTGSFLEDARPLGLLLEDQPYRVLQLDLSLGDGGRQGQVLLALPAEGRAQRLAPHRQGPAAPEAGTAAAASGSGFTVTLGETVMASPSRLDAVIARVRLPLRAVMGLQADLVIPLPMATVEAISVEGIDGRVHARARLGQHRGLRALRLTAVEETAASPLSQPATPGETAGPAGGAATAPYLPESGLLATG